MYICIYLWWTTNAADLCNKIWLEFLQGLYIQTTPDILMSGELSKVIVMHLLIFKDNL